MPISEPTISGIPSQALTFPGPPRLNSPYLSAQSSIVVAVLNCFDS
jgi:hypothetical protein